MEMEEVRRRAKEHGIKTFRMKKGDMIRGIQSAEGNFPCFKTADGYCDQAECCWKEDCLDARG